MAAAKIEGKNWRSSLEEYVHVHNTVKPHARLGITPFELLVGWKHRGIFPSLWDSKLDDVLDRHDVRDNDALTKLRSKKYADCRRGAKNSEISVGDIVLMAIPKKGKTDPPFSDERFTVLSRDGAKVVIRSDRGVQYTRSVNDLKLAPLLHRGFEHEPPQETEDLSDANSGEVEVTWPIENDSGRISLSEPEIAEEQPGPVDKAVTIAEDANSGQVEYPVMKKALRPARNIRKPERFNDMCLYNIFQ